MCGMRDFPCGAVSVQGKVRKKIEEKGTLSGCKNWKPEGFRFFQVEEIYTEKMITLSNVSHDPPWVGDVSRQQGDPELWLPGRDHFFFFHRGLPGKRSVSHRAARAVREGI